MHNIFSSATLAMALAATVQAHMEMIDPPPFRSKNNKLAMAANVEIDYSMTSPLAPSGANYPCKGYLKDLGTPAGASVVTYSPGQSSSVKIAGGAAHEGGSCQISLSYDKGATFKVIKSIIGDCPQTGGSTLDFTIPDDAPTGEAVLSWSWNNKVGNPELYQNCAAVTIGGAKRVRNVVKRAAVAFSSRPNIFLSNIGNGCATSAMVVDYPNPGPDADVQRNSAGQKPSCDGGAGTGTGGGSGSSPSGGSGSSPSGGSGSSPTGGSGSSPSGGSGSSPTTSAKPTTTAGGNGGSPAASTPGGVFVSKPAPSAPAASNAPAASSAPANGGSPAATKTSSSSSSSPTGGSGAGTGSGSAGQLSGACTEEGAWNCLGDSFQRCASGIWSAPMPAAAGTKCAAGKSMTLTMLTTRKARRGVRRSNSAWEGPFEERSIEELTE